MSFLLTDQFNLRSQFLLEEIMTGAHSTLNAIDNRRHRNAHTLLHSTPKLGAHQDPLHLFPTLLMPVVLVTVNKSFSRCDLTK